jgi:hypothetical protein
MMNEDVALMSNTVKKEKEIEYSTTTNYKVQIS